MKANFFHAIAMAAALIAASAHSSLADATIPTEDIAGAADNTLVQRYDGSFIVSQEKRSYTDFSLPLSPLEPSADPDKRDRNNNRVFLPQKKLDLEGALTRTVYVLPAERSPLEVLRNYQDVIEGKGGEVLFECRKEECGGASDRAAGGGGGDMSLTMFFFDEGDIKDADFSNGKCALTSWLNDQRYLSARIPGEGGDTYIAVQTFTMLDELYCKALNDRTIAVVQILEPKGRDRKMVTVEAAKMQESISATGSISLYGLYFDTDKADIKPESAPTLDEIAKLLKGDPKMAVVVVGHTDSQGSFDYNVDLSARRAKAVAQALSAQYGIESGRLTAAGAGMMAPVASNDSEEGRAKNRRVVLVKAN